MKVSSNTTLVFYLSSIHLFGYVKVNERPTKWMVTEGEWKIKDEAVVGWRASCTVGLSPDFQTSSTKGRQRFNPNQRLDVDHRRLNLWRSLDIWVSILKPTGATPKEERYRRKQEIQVMTDRSRLHSPINQRLIINWWMDTSSKWRRNLDLLLSSSTSKD